jgi:PAS domain S-box-containing protein
MFKTWSFRLALSGFLVGLIFPVVSTLAALSRLGLPVTLDSIAFVHFGAADRLERWIIDIAPLFLAVTLGAIGRRRDQRDHLVRHLRATGEMRSLLNKGASLETLLNALTPGWLQLIDASECCYAAWDDRSNSPTPMHPRSPYSEKLAALPAPPDGTPLAKWVIDHNAAKIINPPNSTGGAALAVPLAVNARAFGVVILGDRRPTRRFDEADVSVVLSVTDQVALTLDHIRSSAEIRRRARDMEAISQVARSIAAGWDIERILATVVDSAQVRFGMDYAAVATVDEPAGEFVIRAQAGPLARPEALMQHYPLTAGLAGRAYASGQPVYAHDVRDEPDDVTMAGPEIRSKLIIPLRSGKHVTGVMSFGSRFMDAFSAEETMALHMLADQVGVATESARLYADAQRERQRLSAVLASTGDAVIVTDAADRVQLFNRAAERLFGTSADKVIGTRVEEALTLPALVEAYRNSPPDTHVFELVLSDTTTLLGNLTPVRDQALDLVGRVLTLHDISDLKRLDQLKSQMIRMASHDLRNPLNLAFGYLDLLRDAVSDQMGTIGPLLDGLTSGLKRMQKLVEDLLNVERIESASERIRESIDLNLVARLAADELRPQAADKHHTLTVQLAGEPAFVSADPVQMQQALVNLIGNAIKYTPDGGRINVRVKRDANRVIFEVEDNGLGIPKVAQARLFQRFYRVKMRGTEQIEGTGLGLSLVKAVVDQHQGTIEVDSDEGRGSVFQVCLPALAGPPHEAD